MTKPEVCDPERLLNNPFQYSLEIPVTVIISNTEYVKDPADGIIINKKIFLERTPVVKIYTSKETEQFVYNLSDRAQRLYLHILYNLNAAVDYIQINRRTYMDEQKIKSVNTYKAAEKELIRYNFILHTEYKTVFWINPNLFFAGSRIQKYPNNLKIIQKWEQ